MQYFNGINYYKRIDRQTEIPYISSIKKYFLVKLNTKETYVEDKGKAKGGGKLRFGQSKMRTHSFRRQTGSPDSFNLRGFRAGCGACSLLAQLS